MRGKMRSAGSLSKMQQFNNSFIIATLILITSQTSYALIPRDCQGNLTRRNSVCCPSPHPGAPSCGGPGRGVCAEYQIHKENNQRHHYSVQYQDDRLEWPKRLFKYGCHCDNNYWGYACQECFYGWSGKNCQHRTLSRRRNIMTYSARQKRLYQDVLLKAHEVRSEDYVIYNDQDGEDSDPLRQPRFMNATVHQVIIFIHRYSSRSTMHKSASECRNSSRHDFDFSHEAVGFNTWHRYFVLFWEREAAKIAKKYFGVDDFRFPYWDWTDATTCSVCTRDLVGDLSSNWRRNTSPFKNWRQYCSESHQGRCNGCHTHWLYSSRPWSRLTRIWRRGFRFPTRDQITFTLSRNYYYICLDKRYCNEMVTGNSNRRGSYCSFSRALEGECTSSRYRKNHVMHNGVHNAVTGAFHVAASSANDPLFPIHHTQIDRVFSLWYRRYQPHPNEFPNRDTNAGHCRDCNLVGFFPPITHAMLMVDTRTLGYDYDNYDFGRSRRRRRD